MKTVYSEFYPPENAPGVEGSTLPALTSERVQEIVDDLDLVASDDTLTRDEKVRVVLPRADELEYTYQKLVSIGNALGINYPYVNTKRVAWANYLSGLNPAWNDTTQNSTIDRVAFKTRINEYTDALLEFQNLITTEASKRADVTKVYDGPSVLPRSDIRTPEGISAGFNGQGALSYRDSVNFTSAADVVRNVALTQGNSLTEDPAMQDPSAWQYYNVSLVPTSTGKVSQYVARNTPNTTGQFNGSRFVPVDQNKTYMLEGWFRRSADANGTLYSQVDLHDVNDNQISGDGSYWLYSPIGIVLPDTNWHYYARVFGAGTAKTIPSNAQRMRVGALLNYNNGAGNPGNAGYYETQGLRVVEVTRIGGNLYRADGSPATEPQIVTSQGISQGINNQGDLATQSTANWETQVTGNNRPANNAGTTLTLLPLTGGDTNVRIQGNLYQKVTYDGTWAAGGAFSQERYTGGCKLSGRFVNTGSASMMGITDDTGNTQGWERLKYGIYQRGDGTYDIREFGAFVDSAGLVTGTSNYLFEIEYDGSHVKYWYTNEVGGTREIWRIVETQPSRTFRAQFVTASGGQYSGVRDIKFEPFQSHSLASLTLFDRVNRLDISGNAVRLPSGRAAGWYANAYSLEGYSGSCVITGQMNNGSFIGLSEGRGAVYNDSYTDFPYSFHKSSDVSSSHVSIYQNGNYVLACGEHGDAAVYRIVYDGIFVRYYIGDTLYHTATTYAGRTFYAGVTGYLSGVSKVWNINFGPAYQVARLGSNTFRGDTYDLVPQSDIRTPEGIAGGISGQGPGATAPANRVLNDRLENGVRLIQQPDGGSFRSNTYEAYGAIQIVLPYGATNTMMSFEVEIYDYNTESSQRYIIGGYNYTLTSWINVFARYIGPRSESKPVKFGYYNGKAYIWIGNANSHWKYPQVTIRNFQAGYNNEALDWQSGWNISLNTSDISSLVYAIIPTPRAGDQVFGEGLYESPGGAVATRPNFRTDQGISAGLYGEGPFARLQQPVSRIQYLDNNGRIIDGRGLPYNAANGAGVVLSPTYPLSGTPGNTSTQISVAATTVTLIGGVVLSMPSANITGLTANTVYSIFRDTYTNTYVAVTGQPTSYFTNADRYIYFGQQFTAADDFGGYSPPPPPPPGGGGGAGNCVDEDTLILMWDHSYVRAGNLKNGDRIFTCLEMDVINYGIHEITNVTFVEEYCTKLTMEDGREIVVTPEHRFYTSNGGYLHAKDIRNGTIILGLEPGLVKNKEFAGKRTVAKITVDSAKTYISDGLLSHNIKMDYYLDP